MRETLQKLKSVQEFSLYFIVLNVTSVMCCCKKNVSMHLELLAL